MSDALKPAARRELRRQLDQRGFTRERMEAHIRKLLRPRPRWVPKAAWAAVARVVIRDLPAIEQVELERVERELIDWLVGRGGLMNERGYQLVERIRFLRAQLPQGPAQ